MIRTIFDEIEAMFNESFNHMFDNDIFERLQLDDSTSGPLCCGYSIHIGSDGKPVVKTYGNVKPQTVPSLSGSKEPLVDILKDDKMQQVKLVVEMPGVEKTDIKVHVEKNTVHINAQESERKYQVDVPLNYRVQPDTSRATYKNGILELTFKLANQEKSRGKPVEVE